MKPEDLELLVRLEMPFGKYKGKLIADLQKTVAKKDDQTRFLWFGSGAAVFLIGMLAGKTSNRKKNKFTY